MTEKNKLKFRRDWFKKHKPIHTIDELDIHVTGFGAIIVWDTQEEMAWYVDREHFLNTGVVKVGALVEFSD